MDDLSRPTKEAMARAQFGPNKGLLRSLMRLLHLCEDIKDAEVQATHSIFQPRLDEKAQTPIIHNNRE